ncbi:MAG: hypothetical protein ACK2UN_09570 [Candidatus Promineifilaceae bacterium]
MSSRTATSSAQRIELVLGSAMPMLLCLLLLLAVALRFYKLDAQSFWNDEGNSARLSERPLALIIEGTASDVHPPLYYVILHSWRELVGDSEFGLRSFSAFAGVLTVAATIALAQFFGASYRVRATGAVLVLASALLAAINPTLVYYSQETRMYALLSLLGALSTVVLLRWLSMREKRYWSLAYIIFTTAGLYTHYFYPTILLFQAVIVLFWVLRSSFTPAFPPMRPKTEPHWARTPLRWLGMVVLSLLLYLPWVPIFLRQTVGRSGEHASIPIFLWDSVRWLTFGETIARDNLIWITFVAILLLGWAAVFTGPRVLIPITGTVLPVAVMYIIGTTNPAFFKFMIVAIPFYLIWLAGALLADKQMRKPSSLGASLVAGLLFMPLLWGMAQSLDNLYNDPAYARADYRGMAAEIAAAGDVNAGVILDAPNQWEAFTYYHKEGAPVYPLPKGQPDPQIIAPELTGIAARHDRLYVLYWGEEQRDPEGVVEQWLDANTFKAAERWVGDVRFAVYSTFQDANAATSSLNINFDEKIILQSAIIPGNVFSAGDIIPIRLSWSAEVPLDERYKVFLHLVDENGAIVAQQDSEPASSPTTTWQPGEIFVDNQAVLLPPELAPGEYRLLVGLYELDNPGIRLPARDIGLEQDYVELRLIEVE